MKADGIMYTKITPFHRLSFISFITFNLINTFIIPSLYVDHRLASYNFYLKLLDNQKRPNAGIASHSLHTLLEYQFHSDYTWMFDDSKDYVSDKGSSDIYLLFYYTEV